MHLQGFFFFQMLKSIHMYIRNLYNSLQHRQCSLAQRIHVHIHNRSYTPQMYMRITPLPHNRGLPAWSMWYTCTCTQIVCMPKIIITQNIRKNVQLWMVVLVHVKPHYWIVTPVVSVIKPFKWQTARMEGEGGRKRGKREGEKG